MKVITHITSAVPGSHKQTILNELEKAQAKVDGVLPIKAIDVVIVVDDSTDGVWGNAFYKNTIQISYDGINLDKERISATFYHELHHLARKNSVGYGSTLTEAIISEGLAVGMEKEMGADISIYGKLSRHDKNRALKEFVSEKDSTGYNHYAWFTSRDTKPLFKGYKLGLYLINDYCKRTHTKPSQLFDIPAQKILYELL